MNYSAAIGFPFRGPHAWANIGMLLLCFLIPVVGPMVVVGYIIGVEKILIANIHADAPRFDFGKFSAYLRRGLWPFLASLVFVVILYIAIFVAVLLFVFGFILAQDNAAAIVSLIILATFSYFGLMGVFGMFAQPMMFKSGLEGSFQAAFDGRFLVDYLKRVGLLSVGVHILAMLIMIVPIMVSMCTIVGIYAALAVLVLFQAHLNTQLYLIYLNRGGRPLAIKPDPLDNTGFPVLTTPAAPGFPPDALPPRT